MLNRNTAPTTQKIEKISFVKPEELWINESVKLLWMQDVPNETSRIDLYFDAGLRKDRNAIVSICSSLLLSGTKHRSSTEIHNQIDQLGAYFDIGLSHEGVLISIFALKNNIFDAFCLIYDSIQDAIFPDKEIAEKITEKRERFKINSAKVGFTAQRKFQEKIFFNTPYDELVQISDFDTISKKEIVDFHDEWIKNGLYKIAVVGNLDSKEIIKITERCKPSCISSPMTYFKNFCNAPGVFHEEKKSAVQSALRIGKTMFNKTHDDFFDFSILNTVLGDYFGSRLMRNIREDKGYTYGIGSTLAETGGSGYFIIGSEVGTEHREASLNEIKKEIELLNTQFIDKSELELVKNYLLGQMLKSADGPYAMMDLFLSVDAYSLDMEFYNRYIERIHQIQTEELKSISKKYLQWDSLSIVSAG